MSPIANKYREGKLKSTLDRTSAQLYAAAVPEEASGRRARRYSAGSPATWANTTIRSGAGATTTQQATEGETTAAGTTASGGRGSASPVE